MCIHFNKDCPTDDVHLAIENDFVLVLSNLERTAEALRYEINSAIYCFIPSLRNGGTRRLL